jgi:hypothetical protein
MLNTGTCSLATPHEARPSSGEGMIRCLIVVLLLGLVGCADPSRGAALNECRLQHYLDSPSEQGQLMADCMAAKSFKPISLCSPMTDEREWDWLVTTFPYDNPQCYRPLGSKAWITTALSPM